MLASEKIKHENIEPKPDELLDTFSNEQDLQLSSSPLEIAHWIKDSKEITKFGSEAIAVALDLPPSSRVGHKNLFNALQIVLREFFIEIPEEIATKIKSGETDIFAFLAPAQENHLKPREVEINTLPGISSLTIKGVEPIDGEDGYFNLFFDFKMKPGKVLPDGTIDFREVNRFPQASKDQLIIRIYEPTTGQYGTDIYGYPIKPNPGKPCNVKIKEGFYFKEGFEEDRKRFFKDYLSKKSGIILCEFSGTPEISNLREISVKNEIRVKNIDFSTGSLKGNANELRCKADIVVEGDIKGCFSVIIDGSLTVRGAVEGETVDATGPVIVNFAKNFIRSGSDMEVGIARNANLIAKKQIYIKRELSDGTIRAQEVLLSPKGTSEFLMGRCEIYTNRLIATGVSIRNIVELNIGDTLFSTLEQLNLQRKKLQSELEKILDKIRNRGAVFGEKLKLAQSFVDKRQKKILSILKQFATMILLGNLSFEKIKSRMNNIETSLGSELKMLTKHLRFMVDLQEQLNQNREKLNQLEKQIKNIEEDIAKIHVDMKGQMKSVGQIKIKCNGFEKTFTTKNFKREFFQLTMSYDPSSGPKIKFLET